LPFYIHIIIFRFRFCIWEKTCNICLSESLISLNIIISNFIHFPTNYIISFFYMAE
jgi:hypothetical protein